MLTSGEIEILKLIFEAILKTGKTPTIREMQLALNQSDDYIIHTLDELEKKDILLRKRETREIISVYPFSLTRTEHQIILENGKKLFAMCAVDALGMPIMFDRKGKIISQCEKCKQEITVDIVKEKNRSGLASQHYDLESWSSDSSCCGNLLSNGKLLLLQRTSSGMYQGKPWFDRQNKRNRASIFKDPAVLETLW